MDNDNQPIAESDIEFILANPWEVSRFEWSLEENEVQETTIGYIQGRLQQSREDGFYRIWKTEAGESIAILGFFSAGDKAYETFFIASKHMDAHARLISVELRKLLQTKDAVYKGCKCYLYSGSNHPKQIPWFRFIGFNYMPEMNRGGTKYFEYQSSYK